MTAHIKCYAAADIAITERSAQGYDRGGEYPGLGGPGDGGEPSLR